MIDKMLRLTAFSDSGGSNRLLREKKRCGIICATTCEEADPLCQQQPSLHRQHDSPDDAALHAYSFRHRLQSFPSITATRLNDRWQGEPLCPDRSSRPLIIMNLKVRMF